MSPNSSHARVGILYEHPLWFEPLFDELDRRDIPFDRIDGGADLADELSPIVGRDIGFSIFLRFDQYRI